MKRIIATLLSLAMVLTMMVMPATAETAEADIIVVGAGGAGLSAAIAAAEAGAEKVIVLEMTAKTGGALNFTSGSMSAAGTIIQAEEESRTPSISTWLTSSTTATTSAAIPTGS